MDRQATSLPVLMEEIIERTTATVCPRRGRTGTPRRTVPRPAGDTPRTAWHSLLTASRPCRLLQPSPEGPPGGGVLAHAGRSERQRRLRRGARATAALGPPRFLHLARAAAAVVRGRRQWFPAPGAPGRGAGRGAGLHRPR